MAKSVNDILFRFLADTKSLDKGTKRARGDFKDTEKGANRLTSAMGGLQKAFIAAGGAFAIREAGEFIFEAAEMAEQADIVADSFDRIFEDSAPGLRNALEQVRLQVGLNSLEFEQLLLTNGQLLKGFGLSTDETARLAEELFRAAGDMAAFKGDVGKTGDALHALNRALVNEFDPLEQFIGGVKASTVAQKALDLGLAETTAEITDQDRAIALLALIADTGADAIGSLSRQEETLASATLEANARLDDLKIKLGREVTPAVIKATEGLLDFSVGLGFLANSSISANRRITELGRALVKMAGYWTGVTLAINTSRSALNAIKSTFASAVRSVQALINTLNRLTKIKIPSFNLPNLSGFVPGFAAGGRPTPGQPSVVGEEGPELFVPDRPGTVIPNGGSGGSGVGGGGITINFNGVVGDPVAVAEEIQDLLELYGRTNNAF